MMMVTMMTIWMVVGENDYYYYCVNKTMVMSSWSKFVVVVVVVVVTMPMDRSDVASTIDVRSVQLFPRGYDFFGSRETWKMPDATWW